MPENKKTITINNEIAKRLQYLRELSEKWTKIDRFLRFRKGKLTE